MLSSSLLPTACGKGTSFWMLQASSPTQKGAATVATQTSPHMLHSALPPPATGRGSAAGSYSEPRPKRARAAREVQALQAYFHLAMPAQRTPCFLWGRPRCVRHAAAEVWLPGKKPQSCAYSSCNSNHLLPAMQVISVTRCSRRLTLTDMHEQCCMPLPAHRPASKILGEPAAGFRLVTHILPTQVQVLSELPTQDVLRESVHDVLEGVDVHKFNLRLLMESLGEWSSAAR